MRFASLLGAVLLVTVPASADPPKLEFPAEGIRPSGQYVRHVPKTTAVRVIYRGVDGVDPVPSDVLNDPRLFLLDTRGLAPGTYRFIAVGTLLDELTTTDFTVVVGTSPKPPVPPGPNPPTPPTPLPDGKFKLAQSAFDAVTANVTDNRVGASQAVAKAYKTVVADVGSGTLKTAEAILGAAGSRATAALTGLEYDHAGWSKANDVIQAKLYALYQANSLARVADFSTALDEIRIGLEAVK